MFTVTPETRHNNDCIIEKALSFPTWAEVQTACNAYAQNHKADDVFFQIEKEGQNSYLYVAFRNGTLIDSAWYGDDHFHYMTETPDGFGCPTCIYG